METEGELLYFVDDERGIAVGRVWVSIEEGDRGAWLSSTEIDEAYRRKGFGKALFVLLEAELSRRSGHAMSLHVAGSNERALRFYQAAFAIETVKEPAVVGHVWFSLSEGGDHAWLQSLALDHEDDRYAWAQEAMEQVEAELSSSGIHRMQAYLFGDEEASLTRLLAIGFQIGGRHMTKRW